jgi:hypothetical protein
MVRLLSIFVSIFILSTTLSSCEKCYDCTKKCGICTSATLPTLSGCTGDENLNGASVDTWKIYLETQGYTCTYNNVEENVCGKEARDNKKATFYECVSE